MKNKTVHYTSEQHYIEAERWLSMATQSILLGVDADTFDAMARIAQVHATLATTADGDDAADYASYASHKKMLKPVRTISSESGDVHSVPSYYQAMGYVDDDFTAPGSEDDSLNQLYTLTSSSNKGNSEDSSEDTTEEDDS